MVKPMLVTLFDKFGILSNRTGQAVIESSSIREAAKASGISEATIYNYLRGKEFLSEYRGARR